MKALPCLLWMNLLKNLCDDGEECEEQVGDYLVANEEAIKISVKKHGRVERFGKVGRYSKRERRPPKEWWKNHFVMRIGQEMQTTNDPPWDTYFLLALESFRGNARNNQSLHCL